MCIRDRTCISGEETDVLSINVFPECHVEEGEPHRHGVKDVVLLLTGGVYSPWIRVVQTLLDEFLLLLECVVQDGQADFITVMRDLDERKKKKQD